VAAEQGRITSDGDATLRPRICKGFEGRHPRRTEVRRDASHHLALAIGDLNPPLYLGELRRGGLGQKPIASISGAPLAFQHDQRHQAYAGEVYS
jgi:hypothetical protein